MTNLQRLEIAVNEALRLWEIYQIAKLAESGYFNIKRDRKLIDNGTHFFCLACVCAVPIEEESLNPNYCQECYKIIGEVV